MSINHGMFETPNILNNQLVSNTYSGLGSATGGRWINNSTSGYNPFQIGQFQHGNLGSLQNAQNATTQMFEPKKEAKPKKKEKPVPKRRIVKVFIADPDDNIPLEKSVIYSGEEKLTDATDEELFFEIDIKELLTKHNTYRTSLINKKIKERTELLEAVKIRDLNMVVVTVAEFA